MHEALLCETVKGLKAALGTEIAMVQLDEAFTVEIWQNSYSKLTQQPAQRNLCKYFL